MDKNTYGSGKIFEDLADRLSKLGTKSDKSKIGRTFFTLNSDKEVFQGKFPVTSRYYRMLKDYYQIKGPQVLSDPTLDSLFKCAIVAKLRQIFNKK